MRHLPGGRRERAHLVTEAQRPMSQDIAHRERRYLIMMGIRVACFLLAIALFVNGAGWYALIPAVCAVVIPYFAVVFANAGREPGRRGALADFQPTIPSSRLEALEARRQAPYIVGYVTRSDHDEHEREGERDPAAARRDRGGHKG